MAAEMLDQHAKDLTYIMEVTTGKTRERIAQVVAQKSREVYEVRTREEEREKRVSESIGFKPQV